MEEVCEFNPIVVKTESLSNPGQSIDHAYNIQETIIKEEAIDFEEPGHYDEIEIVKHEIPEYHDQVEEQQVQELPIEQLKLNTTAYEEYEKLKQEDPEIYEEEQNQSLSELNLNNTAYSEYERLKEEEEQESGGREGFDLNNSAYKEYEKLNNCTLEDSLHGSFKEEPSPSPGPSNIREFEEQQEQDHNRSYREQEFIIEEEIDLDKTIDEKELEYTQQLRKKWRRLFPIKNERFIQSNFESDSFQIPAEEEAPFVDHERSDVGEQYGINNYSIPVVFDHSEFRDKSFAELWEKMDEIPFTPYLRKTVRQEGEGELIDEESTVNVRFAFHFENEEKPFHASRKDCSQKFDLKEPEHCVPGLIYAILSMRIGEYSHFIASHEIMYGELGVPYFVPAKAKCFLHIKVFSTCVVTEVQGQTNFTRAFGRAKGFKVMADKYFKAGQYVNASKSYYKARQLMNCRLCDEDEEEMQQKFLFQVLLNNAVCQNRLKKPALTCAICNDINGMGRLYTSSKALFQNGKALMMLGDFRQAKFKFLAALKLEPKNSEIVKEMDVLREKIQNYNRQIDIQEQFRKEVTEKENKFTSDVKKMCEALLNGEVERQWLPEGLSESEVNIVLECAFDCRLMVDITKDNVYYLYKGYEDY